MFAIVPYIAADKTKTSRICNHLFQMEPMHQISVHGNGSATHRHPVVLLNVLSTLLEKVCSMFNSYLGTYRIMNQMPIVISVVGDHADYHKTALAFMERRIVPVCRVHAQQRRLFSR